MSTPNTTVRSWPALALGAFFAAVTGYVLFADVIGGARVNTGHVLSLAAIVAAIASGHMAWPALRRGQIIPGILLGVLFVAATFYVVVASGARNAETADTKAAIIAANNDARTRETKLLTQAEAMLGEAQRNMARECASGKGKRCDGIRATINVYDAAIRGHKATLKDLGPALAVNGGYAHAAEILVALGAATDAKALAERLALVLPFIVVMIAEVGTIAFLHVGFGHGPASRTNAPVGTGQPKAHAKSPDRPAAPQPSATGTGPSATTGQKGGQSGAPTRTIGRSGTSGRSGVHAPAAGGQPKAHEKRPEFTREQAEADLVTMLALGQSVPSQRTLADRWGRPKQTVSDWLKGWEASGTIPARRQHGREKMVGA
jgi:hypothetical protein